jgi:NAD(P)-dependent dehydrogenase (short-subunit alcohol dehydrogenase family)
MVNAPPRNAVVFGADNVVGAAVVQVLRRDGCIVDTPTLPERTEAAWQSSYVAISQRLSRIDIVVNAAHDVAITPIAETSATTFMAVFDAIAETAWLCQKNAVLALRASGGGKIVVVTSVLARVGAASTTAISAAARGVLMSAKSAALECARAKDDIAINTVLVGRIDGDPTHWPDKTLLPHAPVVTAMQVAEAVAFLTAEGAAYMTGVDVPVDGGFLAT